MDTLLIFQLRSNVEGAHAVLPTLYETANKWKKRHQQDPRSVDRLLRQTVLLRLIMELKSRLLLVQTNHQILQNKGWLNENKAWVYQRWSPEKQQLEPQGKEAMPMDQLLQQVDEAAGSSSAENARRPAEVSFHQATDFADDGTGDHVPMRAPSRQTGQQTSHPVQDMNGTLGTPRGGPSSERQDCNEAWWRSSCRRPCSGNPYTPAC